MTISDDDELEPLDPATERLRRRMIRLLVTSIGIMIVGVMTVLGAVVYRTAGPSEEGLPPAGQDVSIALPAGARVLETSLDEGRALLRVALGEREELILVDLADGGILARYRLGASE